MTDQHIDPSDKEWEEIQKKTPGLEDSQEKPHEDDESKEDEEDPSNEGESKEDKSESKAETKSKDKEEDEDDEDDAEDEEEDKNQPKRPEKYIPIKQYSSEKKQWNETEAGYKKRISELETIAKGKEGTKVNEEKIKQYAEKHGIDLEAARAEIDRLRDAQAIARGDDPEEKTEDKTKVEQPALDEDTQRRIAEADEIKANDLFKKEYDELALPGIQKLWPKATEKQLKDARALIEKEATTAKFIRSDLDYVVFKSQDKLQKIFESRKGPEDRRQAAERGQEGKYVAADFVGGKTSFDVLTGLPADEQNKIIEDMDLKTYEDFNRYLEFSAPIVINRGGKRV